jgi:hypothetical protein
MGIFDLVLIASVLLSLAMLLWAAGLAITRRFRSAARVLAGWLGYVAIYLAVVIVSSLLAPPRQIAMAQNVCFDDWCIAVNRIERGATVPVGSRYRVAFRVASRAKRRPQRERGVTVYLVDSSGQRYSSSTPDGEPPFDIMLSPGEAVDTSREFDVPPEATAAHLVITHEGGFPIGWFIIGQGPFFRGFQLTVP